VIVDRCLISIGHRSVLIGWVYPIGHRLDKPPASGFDRDWESSCGRGVVVHRMWLS
jgi:hypothetical protein